MSTHALQNAAPAPVRLQQLCALRCRGLSLLTLNPIGAPISHAAMHVAAVLHTFKTDLFLPPHR